MKKNNMERTNAGPSDVEGEHTLPTAGSPWIAFAPLDLGAVTTLPERNPGRQEVKHQLKVWAATHAAKDPNRPIESMSSRFRAAVLANIPIAVYCGLCFEVI